MFDAHLHLPADPARGAAFLAGLRSQGVRGVTACAAREAEWDGLQALAACEPGLHVQLGVHPWYLDAAVDGWEERLENRLASSPGLGVGEVGLDRRRGPSLAVQVAVLDRLLGLARKWRRPVSLHCLRAEGLLWESLRAAGLPAGTVLVHGYGGSLEMARELVALGCRISIGPRQMKALRSPLGDWLRGAGRAGLCLESDASTEAQWKDPAAVAGKLRELHAWREGKRS